MIFEDRKVVDIENIVHMQCHCEAFRISEWAHVMKGCGLASDGIVKILTKTTTSKTFKYKDSRALLMLAEISVKESSATGSDAAIYIESNKKHKNCVIEFVTNQILVTVDASSASKNEDFVVFTIDVNRATKGDPLDQQYQTSKRAIAGDFIISGKGIYATTNPVETVRLYREKR